MLGFDDYHLPHGGVANRGYLELRVLFDGNDFGFVFEIPDNLGASVEGSFLHPYYILYPHRIYAREVDTLSRPRQRPLSLKYPPIIAI